MCIPVYILIRFVNSGYCVGMSVSPLSKANETQLQILRRTFSVFYSVENSDRRSSKPISEPLADFLNRTHIILRPSNCCFVTRIPRQNELMEDMSHINIVPTSYLRNQHSHLPVTWTRPHPFYIDVNVKKRSDQRRCIHIIALRSVSAVLR